MNDNVFGPRIIPWQEAFRPSVEPLAKSDGHELVLPSHLVLKNTEVIGSLSLGRVPLALVWLHTKKATVRDTLNTLNFMENAMAQVAPTWCIPCPSTSPLFAYVEKGGYFNGATGAMYFKDPKSLLPKL